MKFGHKLRAPGETICEYILRLIVIAVMAVFIIIALFGNAGILANAVFAENGIIYTLSTIIGVIAFFAVFSRFAEKTEDAYKWWLAVIFIISLTARIAMINAWPIEPENDFKNTYDVALGIAGSYNAEIRSLMRNEYAIYYTTWAAHLPFVLFEALILRIFGEGIYSVQVVFNIFGAMSCVIAAAIAKNIYGRRAGIITGIAMSLFPLSLMYAPVLTNQHIATFFFLLAVYFISAAPLGKRLANVAAASASAALSQLFRPEMIVFIIAVTAYFFYEYIPGIKIKKDVGTRWRKFIAQVMMLLGVYTVILFAVNTMLLQSGLIRDNITQTNIKYKIAVGLNAQSKGLWNEGDYRAIEDEEKLDALILQRVTDAGTLLGLGMNKIAYQYGTYNYSWCTTGKPDDFVSKWYGPLTNGVMLIILLLCLVRVILSLFGKSHREMFIMIVMIAYFAVFMIIEVQNRYNYFAIPIFIILASGSVVYLHSKAKHILQNMVKKSSNNIVHRKI